MTTLDSGYPEDLARRYRRLRERLPHLNERSSAAAAAPTIDTSRAICGAGQGD